MSRDLEQMRIAMFEDTQDQTLLRDAVRRFNEVEVEPLVRGRGFDEPLDADLLKQLMRKLGQLGLAGGDIPAEYGGAGIDLITFSKALEELHEFLVFYASIHAIACRAIYLNATPQQRGRLLPRMTSGGLIGCLASTEPDAGSNPLEMRTTAVRDGDDYVLNGTKMWISNGSIADVAMVVAVTDRSLGPKGLSSLIVEREVSPWSAKDIPTIGDKTGRVSEMVFEDCRVPKENLMGEEGDGLRQVLRVFNFARCLAGFGGICLAQKALHASLRYVRERKQFGRAIGSFQLIQEMLADMATELDAARLLVYRAMYLQAKGDGRHHALETSMAKYYATEAAVRICSKAVQVHGSYGLSEEYNVARYFRDARMLTLPDGSSQIQQLIIGRELTGLAAFF